MNARNQAFAETSRFIFCSPDSARAQWLATVLGNRGTLFQEAGDARSWLARVAELNPHMVLLDFSDTGTPGGISAAVELAQALTRSAPSLPLVAVGSIAYPAGAVAALRAGVRDFIDVAAPEEDAREIMLRVLAQAATQAKAPVARGRLVTLIGARAGVGTSTLAAHLADLARKPRRQTGAGPIEGSAGKVALLDLGLPGGDGQLYLNAVGDFNFAEAVRNLHRLDETLVHTALAHSRNGVAVLSLPRSLNEMRATTHTDAVKLLERLRLYFDVLVADLGGFTNLEFVATLANASDDILLVTDQSLGALVSLATLLRELDGQDNKPERRRLVVNRYDERHGMNAEQIAKRFDLPLAATLPERTLRLMSCANQGKLLHEVARHDGYVRAVDALVAALFDPDAGGMRPGGIARLLSKLGRVNLNVKRAEKP